MTAPANIYLPGALGRSDYWKPVAERLPQPRELLGWPGFGDVRADPKVQGLADLVPYVVDRLKAPSNLIAQSMGGVIAVRVASAHQLLVRRLVLVATSAGIDMRALAARDWRPELRRSHPTLPSWFEAPIDDMSDALADLGMPTLLLWGSNDPLSPIVVGERLNELIPNSRLVVIEGAGHDLVVEHSERVAELISEHIEPTPIDGIHNVSYVTRNIASSGRITPEALPVLARHGYHTLINLLPSGSEFHVAEEPTIARKLGLDYQQIEVDFEAPQVSDFERFVALMRPRHDEKVWVHCAANYRVSAFLAVYLERYEGWSRARADRLRARMWEPNDVWNAFATRLVEGKTSQHDA